MPRLLFASMHGSAVMDLGLLCRHAGVELWVPLEQNGVIKTLALPSDRDFFESLGVQIAETATLRDRLAEGFFAAMILSTPEQVKEFKQNVEPIRPLPIAIRHGLNAFDKFKKLGVSNFISPSPRALERMGCSNPFLTRKLVPWDSFPKPSSFPEGRSGFFQYIHHYDRWQSANERFTRLQEMISPIHVPTYGFGNPDGCISDLPTMSGAKGTVHIKDGQVACNAVIRSMALGTPVFMDATTYEKCYFDAIEGIEVFDELTNLADRIKLIDQEDDVLEESCERAFAAAKRQFTYNDELGDRFKAFLSRMKQC